MKVTEILNGIDLRPMKVSAREVPHAVIEPNYTCNRRCALCYNRYRDIVKSFDQVAVEVDQALTKRNLETISILGGEPTLHPCLPQIVSYIKSKKLVCQILTNGLVLYKDDQNVLLDRLVQAGLDRIVLHVDCGQGIDQKEMDTMCEALFSKFERRKLYFALSITLYEENKDVIPGLMKQYARYRYFDGILATLARETSRVLRSDSPPTRMPELKAVYRRIANKLRIEPSSYLPSNLDDREIRWLIYFYYMNVNTGATVSISPTLTRLFRRIYRFITGRHMFAATMKASFFKIWFFITTALELLLRPARIPEFIHLVNNSALMKDLRFHYIVLQSAPQFNPEKQCVEICYHCPDATIRNGRFTPVCLADLISPPGKHSVEDGGDTAFADMIYEHLEEV
jgi:uncharacterized Fe-S cluster-containing radical SAM superfamily protein